MKQYLENIQLDFLIEKYGNDYKKEIQRLKNQSLVSDKFKTEFNKFYTSTEKEIIELEDYVSDQFSRLKIVRTQYSIIAQDLIFDSVFQKVYKTVEKLNYDLKDIPYFGTAISSEYNAFACSPPNSDEKLIVFESELFIIANLFSKIIAKSIPLEDKGKNIGFNLNESSLDAHLKTNKEVYEAFFDLMYNTSFLGEPSKTKQYFIEPLYTNLYLQFLNSFEIFVAGHEFGHIIAGHLNNSSSIKTICKKEIDLIETNWKEEFEADAIGLNILINSLDSTNLSPFCYAGADLFFSLLDIDERVYNFIKKGVDKKDEGSQTHPPAGERKKHIRYYLNNVLKDADKDAYNMFVDFLDMLIEKHWLRMKNDIIKEFKRQIENR